MKLRTKILGSLCLLSFVSVAVLSFSLKHTLTNGLLKLERDDHQRNVQRVVDAIKQSEAIFVNKMADWAAWDDTYQFIDDVNPEYIESNLLWNTFDVLEINLVVYLDRQNRVKFFRGRDYTKEVIFKEVPASMATFINERKDVFNWQSPSQHRVGFLRSGDDLYQLLLDPITNSEVNAPPKGTLLSARYFREAQLRRLEEITGYKLRIETVSSDHLAATGEILVAPVSDSTVEGRTIIRDIFKQPVFALYVQAPRLVYNQGLRDLKMILWLVAGLSLALLLGIALIVNSLMVARLRSMHKMVSKLQEWGDDKALANLREFGSDEIGAMGREIHDLYNQVRLLADYDELTGLHNVRFFRSVYQTQFRLAQRHGRSLSVILFDLDHFKSVNDTYGHLQGDRVLKEVGAALKQQVRTTDIAARYGGEEFVVLLNETDAAGAAIVAEKIRRAIEQLEIASVKEGEKPLKVTISLGIAGLGKQASPDDLIKSADGCLYSAKQSGRNCCRTEDLCA